MRISISNLREYDNNSWLYSQGEIIAKAIIVAASHLLWLRYVDRARWLFITQTECLDGIIVVDRGLRNPPDCSNQWLTRRMYENGSARARASPRWKMQIAFRDMGYNSGTLASEVKVSRDIVHTLSEEPSCGILSYSVLRCWCTFIKTCEYDYVWMRLLRGDISILFEE